MGFVFFKKGPWKSSLALSPPCEDAREAGHLQAEREPTPEVCRLAPYSWTFSLWDGEKGFCGL